MLECGQKYEWLVEVLTDLDGFARKNGLPRFQMAISFAADVMLSEIEVSETQEAEIIPFPPKMNHDLSLLPTRRMDLSSFRSGDVVILGGPSFERRGEFPAKG